MKILVVSDVFTRGGLETQIKTYYENLPADSQMVFAFSKYSDEVCLENAKIYTDFNFFYYATLSQLCQDVERLVEIIEKEEIDVIHVHPFFAFFPALFASQITKTKLVYSFHGVMSFNFTGSAASAALFRYAFEVGAVAKLFSVSDIGLDCFKALGYNNSVFMPNPIDTQKYKKANFIANKKWALFSRIDADKLKDITLFLKNKDNYGIECVDIYGSGDCISELQEFIDNNNLSSTVKFMGFCNDLPATLNNNYNGVVGIGRVVLEALTMGFPVFFIGYGKLTGFVNKNIFEKIKFANFSNLKLNDVNFNFPSSNEIEEIRVAASDSFSVNSILTNYLNELDSCNSFFAQNLCNLYYELKGLINDEQIANSCYLSERSVYSKVRHFIGNFTVSANLNNIFVAYDNDYILYDALTQNMGNLENRINAIVYENSLLKAEVERLAAAEQARIEKQQRINRRFHHRVFRKLRRILTNKR